MCTHLCYILVSTGGRQLRATTWNDILLGIIVVRRRANDHVFAALSVAYHLTLHCMYPVRTYESRFVFTVLGSGGVVSREVCVGTRWFTFGSSAIEVPSNLLPSAKDIVPSLDFYRIPCCEEDEGHQRITREHAGRIRREIFCKQSCLKRNSSSQSSSHAYGHMILLQSI